MNFTKITLTSFVVLITFAIANMSFHSKVFAQASPLIITTTELPAATVGQPFSVQLQAAGGTAPYNWGLPRSEGTPYPFTFNFTGNGVLSGTPTATEVGSYITRLQVTDSAGAVTTKTFTLTVYPAPIIAENSGGGAVGRFAADTSFGTIEGGNIGNTYSTNAAIDISNAKNPAPGSVYQSERWGDPSFTYTLAGLRTQTEPRLTPNVTYLVRLHFAEIYFSNSGERQFNVDINGQRVLTNFDIVAQAGGARKAIVKEFTATATARGGIGIITVNFTQGAIQNPKLSAIEVLPATIFAGQRPAQPDATDNRSYELGTKFVAAINGEIRAIRYWKSPSETGTHIGRIWSATGTLLTTVNFANETASGWQEAVLAVPLRITRNTLYTVSVNTNTNFAITVNELNYPGISNGFLETVIDETNNNGVFGDIGAYPTNSFQGSNYYRDVVFVESSAPAQTIFTAQSPVLPDASDNRSYELGTKFIANVGGEIRSIRYWKSPSETGAHSGRIWAANGGLLATAVFNNESSSGWQETVLTTPLTIAANTVYIVSVNSNSHYAFTLSGLANPVSNGNLRTVADNNNGVFGDINTFPTSSYSNSNYFRDVGFVPSVTTPAPATPFVHRGYLGWINDLSSVPRANEEWPSITIDNNLRNDYRNTFAMMNQSGLNETTIWGFFAARDWSVDVENTIDQSRAQQVRGIINDAHDRNVKVLVGMGAYSWGYNAIIQADPQIACANNSEVMNPTVERSWYWQKRVIDYVMTFPVDGVSLQSADLGRCQCPTCPSNDVDYHAQINNRIAQYIKINYPGKIVGINGFGLNLENPADLPYVVAMTRNADYLIDVQDTVRRRDSSYRRTLIAAIAPASFGNIGSTNVEPPQHWERDRWFLPITARMAPELQSLYNDGGRAVENYMRTTTNPGDEVSIKLAAAIELNPTADWRVLLENILVGIYQPPDATAKQQLSELFLGAENAYFENAYGYGTGDIVRLEPLFGNSPGPAIYLTDHMNAAGRARYASRLRELRTLAQILALRVGNQTRMTLVVRCLDRALADLAQIG